MFSTAVRSAKAPAKEALKKAVSAQKPKLSVKVDIKASEGVNTTIIGSNAADLKVVTDGPCEVQLKAKVQEATVKAQRSSGSPASSAKGESKSKSNSAENIKSGNSGQTAAKEAKEEKSVKDKDVVISKITGKPKYTGPVFTLNPTAWQSKKLDEAIRIQDANAHEWI